MKQRLGAVTLSAAANVDGITASSIEMMKQLVSLLTGKTFANNDELAKELGNGLVEKVKPEDVIKMNGLVAELARITEESSWDLNCNERVGTAAITTLETSFAHMAVEKALAESAAKNYIKFLTGEMPNLVYGTHFVMISPNVDTYVTCRGIDTIPVLRKEDGEYVTKADNVTEYYLVDGLASAMFPTRLAVPSASVPANLPSLAAVRQPMGKHLTAANTTTKQLYRKEYDKFAMLTEFKGETGVEQPGAVLTRRMMGQNAVAIIPLKRNIYLFSIDAIKSVKGADKFIASLEKTASAVMKKANFTPTIIVKGNFSVKAHTNDTGLQYVATPNKHISSLIK